MLEMLGAFNYNNHHHIGQANLIQFTIGIIFNNNYTESKTLLEIRRKKSEYTNHNKDRSS